MADYRMPMDADGIKYHGTVDQNEENPGQFMYGLDENGNKRIIRTDENGNVLTRVTGSNAEEVILRNITVSANSSIDSGTIPLEGVDSISVGIRLERPFTNNSIKIYFRWRNGLGQFMDNSRKEFKYHTNVTANHSRILTERTELLTSRLVIYIENTSDEDINLSDVYIYKYT